MSHAYPKAARETDRARVVELDAEIGQLRQRIRALQMERESCQQRLDAYRHPVVTLPNEITSEIFIQFLPPYPAYPPLRGYGSPTSLTRICRKWREIALATPQLWRAISTSDTENHAEQTQTVKSWLTRSGSCPLSIQMVLGDQVPTDRFAAILLHRDRWQHVKLRVATKTAVALIKGPMPLLENLALSIQASNYTKPTTSVDDFPRLRTLTLHGYDVHHGDWLPVSRLTSLAFREGGSRDYLPLLRGALNLIHLYMDGCIPPESPQNIQLPRLETLVLDMGGHSEDSVQMLDIFILPALQTLQVDGELLGLDPVRSLATFISRSGCKLQQVLIIGSCEASEESLRAALPEIPKIAFDPTYHYWAWDY